MDPRTPSEKGAWRCDQTANGAEGNGDKWVLGDLSQGEQTAPSKPGSHVEANHLEEGELLTGEDSHVPFRAQESRTWGSDLVPGWLPETTLGASFHC